MELQHMERRTRQPGLIRTFLSILLPVLLVLFVCMAVILPWVNQTPDEPLQPLHWRFRLEPFVLLPLFFIALAGLAWGLARKQVQLHLAQEQLKQQKRLLQETETHLRRFAENAHDLLSVHDPAGCYLYVSPACRQMLGYEPHELVGQAAYSHFHPDDVAAVSANHQRVLEGKTGAVSYRIRHHDGHYVRVESSANIVRDPVSHEISEILVVTRDISERYQSDQTRRKLSQALEQAADTVMITDTAGQVEYVNGAFTDVTGFRADEIKGRKPKELLYSGHLDTEFYRRLWQTLNAGDIFRDVFINRRKDGSLYYEERTISPLKNEHGEITHFIATGKDITDQVQAQKRLRQLAYHDALTGLANRSLLHERLEQALSRARRHQQLVAVIFIDLDRFKDINDTLGHEVGDRLLKVVASRLLENLREEDTVARLGGDEFVVLLEELEHATDIIPIAEKLITQVAQPIQVATHQLHTSASLGISLYPRDGETVSTLLKHADAAMYQAKAGGRNTFSFFSEELNRRKLLRLELEKELYRAIQDQEFQLRFQPQVSVGRQRMVGLEALLRWQHPVRGLVAPGAFISILEETGQVVDVGRWVLREVCQQVVQWRKQFGDRLPRVAINLSARQLSLADCVEQIQAVLQETGCPPQALELEITESTIMENLDSIQDKLEQLHAMGLRLAVDDFGTGYSSLAYLKRFPLHVLKIDKTFVDGLPHDRDDTSITQAIISLGHSLGLQVLAEGVESREQAQYLREKRCDVMQGFLFHHPLPADTITELLMAEGLADDAVRKPVPTPRSEAAWSSPAESDR